MLNATGSTEFWSIRETIGTIASAIIGATVILLATVPFLLKFLRKPSLHLEPVISRTTDSWRTFVIQITNKGEETAKNIIVKMESIELEKNESIVKLEDIFEAENLYRESPERFSLLDLDWKEKVLIFREQPARIKRQNSTISLLITGENVTTFRQSFMYVDADDIQNTKLLRVRARKYSSLFSRFTSFDTVLNESFDKFWSQEESRVVR
ncbi:MAG: hypothetical protein JSV18_04385 [Candidatus Bathyarchaeota archaeon]|nr:MAG: hypothetical protein JSV18_04385 [Candidatus Bathyarchaeota archaeon]